MAAAVSSTERRVTSIVGQAWRVHSATRRTIVDLNINLPPDGSKWQASTGFGAFPRWRADGRELFYEAAGPLMALDPKLLEILACPEDKGPLLYFADEDALYNPRLKRRYLIEDDIPIMLIDEAQTVSDEEHERLLQKAEREGIKPTFEPA